MEIPVIAASTQRQIGYVIAGLVLLAMFTYWVFNWLEGRRESGSEIELAANRKPNMSDEEMETKRLDLALAGGLALLTIIALAYPLYWLGEPGRQQGLVEFTDSQSVKQGAELYEANCAQCHGSADGPGGAAQDFSLVDSNGVFVEQVQWTAPSLAAVLDRFSYDETKYILNFGRTNSPMPAWGAPGGGPMTDQQIDKVIAYLAASQKTTEEIRKEVDAGVDTAAVFKARQDNPALYAAQLEHADWIHDIEENHDLFPVLLAEDNDFEAAYGASQSLLADLRASDSALDETATDIEGSFDPDGDETAADAAKRIEVELALLGLEQAKKSVEDDIDVIADGFIDAYPNDEILYGELLFNNPAAGGAYGCARCHSAGYSYNANDFPENTLIDPINNGGGGLGPSLTGVSDQFADASQQSAFIAIGSKNGQRYGNFGQGDGGGGMPGFGQCNAEDNVILPRIQSERIAGHCDGTSLTAIDANEGQVLPRAGILTQAQIDAIVAYERSLES